MPDKSLVEHVSFTASEAFLADKSLFDQLKIWLDKNVEGCLNVFWGFEVQEPTHAHIFVLWQSFDFFTQASKHPDFLPGFMAHFSTLLTAPGPTVQFIDFDDDPTSAFSGPVTEFSTVKLKEGHTQAEVDEVTEQIKANVGGLEGVHLPLVRGPVRNTTQSEYAQAAGWDSIEAHMNAVKTPPVDVLGAKLFGIADMVFKHLVLKKA